MNEQDLIMQHIQHVRTEYSNYLDLINHYLVKLDDSKMNWLHKDKKQATYIMGIIPDNYLVINKRPTYVKQFITDSNRIHTDELGDKDEPVLFEFSKAYRYSCYLTALYELLDMVNTGNIFEQHNQPQYKSVEQLLDELQDSLTKSINFNIEPHLKKQLSGINTNPTNYINQWVTYPDSSENDLNFKTHASVSDVPYPNPLHLSDPSNLDFEIVNKLFKVYFDEQYIDILYNWLGAALLNISQTELKRMIVITGKPGTGKSSFIRKILLDNLLPQYYQTIYDFRLIFGRTRRKNILKNRRVTCFEDIVWSNDGKTPLTQNLNAAAFKDVILDGYTNHEFTSLNIGISYRQPVITEDLSELDDLLLCIPIKDTYGNQKCDELNMSVNECITYLKTNIDSFIKVFTHAYLKNTTLLSTAKNHRVLPTGVKQALTDLSQSKIPTNALVREILSLRYKSSLVAKKDDEYVYLNISAKGLSSVGITDRKMAVTILKNYGEETPNPINFRTETESTKARAIKIKLQNT